MSKKDPIDGRKSHSVLKPRCRAYGIQTAGGLDWLVEQSWYFSTVGMFGAPFFFPVKDIDSIQMRY